jgi:hypothetical protein
MRFGNFGVTELLVCLVPAFIIIVIAGVAVVAATLLGRRRCPHCQERIRAKATVCRYCGRDV